jgi:phosphoribosylformimino-5-aminoimidazole carboxamide ribotide isomerase
VIIPSIDIIDGQAVQLRQGKERVLTDSRDPLELVKEFNRYGEVAVIDLDAALGKGDNLDLIRQMCRHGDLRVGGGIRSVERGQQLLRAGAKSLIIGTAATPGFLSHFAPERVMVALDHVDGEVVDKGWTQGTGETILDRAARVADHCSGFLCTFVEDEGCMKGIKEEEAVALAKQLPHPVTVAGGVCKGDEVIRLSQAGLDVQVGMAMYTGQLDPIEVVVGSLDFEKCPHMPTVVIDQSGQLLMQAYSTPESLTLALKEGKGIYFSRSRQELWEKGKTSGHTQKMLSCRTDCDRDSLVFRVEQTGKACHRESYSCFGSQRNAPEFSLHRLFDILKSRKANSPEGSFSAKLFADRKLLQRKIMEEAFEVVTYADRRELVWELADSIFFMSALAVDEGIELQEIIDELGGRHK